MQKKKKRRFCPTWTSLVQYALRHWPSLSCREHPHHFSESHSLPYAIIRDINANLRDQGESSWESATVKKNCCCVFLATFKINLPTNTHSGTGTPLDRLFILHSHYQHFRRLRRLGPGVMSQLLLSSVHTYCCVTSIPPYHKSFLPTHCATNPYDESCPYFWRTNPCQSMSWALSTYGLNVLLP